MDPETKPAQNRPAWKKVLIVLLRIGVGVVIALLLLVGVCVLLFRH